MKATRKQILFCAIWFLAVTVPLTCLMTAHTIVLNAPGIVRRLPASVDWQTYHFLSTGCGCSFAVSKYLLERTPKNDIVVWIGKPVAMTASLREHGYPVRELSEPDAVKDFDLQGAPAIIITRPDGTIAYSGGYAPQKVSELNPPQDREVLESVRASISVTSYPVFGCAIGSRIKKAIDPAKLKY